jgi:hypothetical protein
MFGNEETALAMVWFEKRFVSGHRFSDADHSLGTSRFSRWGLSYGLAAEAGFKLALSRHA